MTEPDTIPESDEVVEPNVMTEAQVRFLIPDCCREGWDDCPHVVNRDQVRRRTNIGL